MSNEELKNKISSLVPEAEFEETKQYLNVTVPANKLKLIATKLKETEELGFDYMFCLTGVDLPECFMIVYHLSSYKHKHEIVLKVKTADRINPVVETVCNIWRTAEFHEREVYDLLGVKFANHPDMRRLFLDEEWPGHPLRKDYVDEINIVER